MAGDSWPEPGPDGLLTTIIALISIKLLRLSNSSISLSDSDCCDESFFTSSSLLPLSFSSLRPSSLLALRIRPPSPLLPARSDVGCSPALSRPLGSGLCCGSAFFEPRAQAPAAAAEAAAAPPTIQGNSLFLLSSEVSSLGTCSSVLGSPSAPSAGCSSDLSRSFGKFSSSCF